jgi:hypothetical protein
MASKLLGFVAAALLAACFSTTDPAPSEKTCESNCDRQANAGCASTPADFASTCKEGCVVHRASFPDCVSAMDAVAGCVDRKVTYQCDANGKVEGTPVGRCLEEDYACFVCTGDSSMCRY